MVCNNIFYGILLLICTVVVSCTAEEHASEEPSGALTTYSFRLYGESTRASLDETSYKMRWDGGDKIDIWSGSTIDSLNKCAFVTKDGGINNAYFTYTGPSMGTKVYFGFYPSKSPTSTSVHFEVPVDGSVQQRHPDDASHLKDYQAMYSDRIERDTESNELTKLQFHHLTSLIILKIHNERSKPVTCKSVYLAAEDGSGIFTSSAVYGAGSNNPSADLSPYSSSSSGLKLGDTGLEVSPSSTIKCFLPILPSGGFAHTRLTFTLSTDMKEYTMVFPEDVSRTIGSFKQSTYYIFNLRLKDNMIELIPSGISAWEEGLMGDVTLRPS